MNHRIGDKYDRQPLSEVEAGECAFVCGHTGGRELTRRLAELGLNDGAEVEVLTSAGGPVTLACRGCRLALGRGMSQKILVRTVPSFPDRTVRPPRSHRRMIARIFRR